MRRACAEALIEIGFDGYGYGGWPISTEGKLLDDMLALTRELIPARFPMHGLGIGHPASVVACARMGYDLFDSALPTRDARRGRLYRLTQADGPLRDDGSFFEFVYLRDKHYIKDDRPVDASCQGECCARYSLGYLQHLLRIEETLFCRLATIHNLLFMRRLTRRLAAERQAAVAAGVAVAGPQPADNFVTGKADVNTPIAHR